MIPEELTAYDEAIRKAAAPDVLPDWNHLPQIELYMDQVLTLMNRYLEPFIQNSPDPFLTPAMINSYVKLGLLPPPVRKKYGRVHLSRLIVICLMKSVCSIAFINDLIKRHLKTMTDEEFYNYFCVSYRTVFKQMEQDVRHFLDEADHKEDPVHALAHLSFGAAMVASSTKFLSKLALQSAIELNRKEKQHR